MLSIPLAIRNCGTVREDCHQFATCADTGPGTHKCTCNEWYTGDGKISCTGECIYYMYAINACIQKQNILKGQLFFPISSLFFLFYLFLSRGPGGTFRNNIIHILFYIILY